MYLVQLSPLDKFSSSSLLFHFLRLCFSIAKVCVHIGGVIGLLGGHGMMAGFVGDGWRLGWPVVMEGGHIM